MEPLTTEEQDAVQMERGDKSNRHIVSNTIEFLSRHITMNTRRVSDRNLGSNIQLR
jgi:hypothetical protein